MNRCVEYQIIQILFNEVHRRTHMNLTLTFWQEINLPFAVMHSVAGIQLSNTGKDTVYLFELILRYEFGLYKCLSYLRQRVNLMDREIVGNLHKISCIGCCCRQFPHKQSRFLLRNLNMCKHNINYVKIKCQKNISNSIIIKDRLSLYPNTTKPKTSVTHTLCVHAMQE